MGGFIRRQEERLAVRYLVWRYQRINSPIPSASELDRTAVQIVDEAHRIAHKRGRNVMSIIKEMVDDLKKG